MRSAKSVRCEALRVVIKRQCFPPVAPLSIPVQQLQIDIILQKIKTPGGSRDTHTPVHVPVKRHPVCVPCVSRLPPVSFYRFKDTGGDGNPQSRRTPHAHDLRFETFRSAVQYRYRLPVNKHGVARAVWPCRIRPMSSLSMSWWRSFPIKRSRSTPKPCSSIGSISPIRMVMVASHWMTSFPGR